MPCVYFLRICSKLLITNNVCEWFLFSCSMKMCFFKSPLSKKCCTNITVERLFFPSWSEEIWVLSFVWPKKHLSHMSHLNGFFLSWTDGLCKFMWLICVKPVSQMSHLYFLPSWTSFLCFFQLKYLLNLVSQRWHANLFIKSWAQKGYKIAKKQFYEEIKQFVQWLLIIFRQGSSLKTLAFRQGPALLDT